MRARWGGEEFALAFAGQSAPVIQRAVEQLLEEFYALEMTSESGETFHAASPNTHRRRDAGRAPARRRRTAVSGQGRRAAQRGRGL